MQQSDKINIERTFYIRADDVSYRIVPLTDSIYTLRIDTAKLPALYIEDAKLLRRGPWFALLSKPRQMVENDLRKFCPELVQFLVHTHFLDAELYEDIAGDMKRYPGPENIMQGSLYIVQPDYLAKSNNAELWTNNEELSRYIPTPEVDTQQQAAN